jgi:hypothetical protein
MREMTRRVRSGGRYWDEDGEFVTDALMVGRSGGGMRGPLLNDDDDDGAEEVDVQRGKASGHGLFRVFSSLLLPISLSPIVVSLSNPESDTIRASTVGVVREMG